MFTYGVDYYPEHWPEERWPVDARLMAEAGFNLVRLAEFAWSRLEPRDDEYDFAWLDRALDVLAGQGIRVVLGTPTASPPPWLMAPRPDLFLVRADGQRATFGNRREYCPNQPLYQQYSRRIVEAMADHYAGHPAVIGWQIDNEFGERCYCPVCRRAFQDWLRQRYPSLDALNAAWGTIFWSHVYNDWSEVPAPVATGGSPNPGLALDYDRFCSDSYVHYQSLQAGILRARCPGHFITHNFMGFGYGQINYFDLARDLDFVTWDNYPRTQWKMEAEPDLSGPALSHDTMRGLKRQNFWVMEEQAGPGGWEMVAVTPRPGEMRLWAYQAIAHGADAIVYFRWRTARFGTEEYWHGILDHHGEPGRRYAEAKRMGAELKRAGDAVASTEVRSRVGLLQDYDSRWAFQIQPNNPGFDYRQHFHDVYRSLHKQHVSIDVVPATEGELPYALVVAPALHVVAPETAQRLERYVAGGGVLVLTARSGVKEPSNAVVDKYLPGPLAGLVGAHLEEYDSLPVGAEVTLEAVASELKGAGVGMAGLRASVWCDILASDGAKVIARYGNGYYAGQPAITLNDYGQGKVVYVGVLGPAALFEALAPWLLRLAGVEQVLDVPAGVEVQERWLGDRRLLFVLNHTAEPQEILLGRRFRDLLAEGGAPSDRLALAGKDVVVLDSE